MGLRYNARLLSVAVFAIRLAYMISFPFQGQALYSAYAAYGIEANNTVIHLAIVAVFLGQFSSGYYIKSLRKAKSYMLITALVSSIATVPFFFAPGALWTIGLLLAGFSEGSALSAWGFYLKEYTPKNERIKSCADLLIISNIIMIAINVAAAASHVMALILSILCLVVGGALLVLVHPRSEPAAAPSDLAASAYNIKTPMILLFLFVAIITIDSGLMYQVINPAFAHLEDLVSWYWAVPYIAAVAVMRNQPMRAKRSVILYVGMAMIIGAFICFMLLGRGSMDYLAVDTLMLGACGIFDLFWWSILGETLDYTVNPGKLFGFGLSANVLGVLLGGVLGAFITSIQLSGAEVAVIALCVVCVSVVILPPLNRMFVQLLKSHVYLSAYADMSVKQQTEVIQRANLTVSLTERELEVFQLILEGKSNKEITACMNISEGTVKFHLSNIYAKHGVSSRAELISGILKSQITTREKAL